MAPGPSLRLPALTGETRASSRDTPGAAFWAPAARCALLSHQAPGRTHGLAPAGVRERARPLATPFPCRRPHLPQPRSCQQRWAAKQCVSHRAHSVPGSSGAAALTVMPHADFSPYLCCQWSCHRRTAAEASLPCPSACLLAVQHAAGLPASLLDFGRSRNGPRADAGPVCPQPACTASRPSPCSASSRRPTRSARTSWNRSTCCSSEVPVSFLLPQRAEVPATAGWLRAGMRLWTVVSSLS